jgi:hypothetical protein
MLDEGEWAQLAPLLSKVPQDIKDYRERTGAALDVATKQGFEREALERYEQLTGFRETNINALWHHRLAEVGPPCEACGKPLRTDIARFCAECGHVTSNNSLERTRDR